MKKYNKFLIVAPLLIGALSLTSCAKEITPQEAGEQLSKFAASQQARTVLEETTAAELVATMETKTNEERNFVKTSIIFDTTKQFVSTASEANGKTTAAWLYVKDGSLIQAADIGGVKSYFKVTIPEVQLNEELKANFASLKEKILETVTSVNGSIKGVVDFTTGKIISAPTIGVNFKSSGEGNLEISAKGTEELSVGELKTSNSADVLVRWDNYLLQKARIKAETTLTAKDKVTTNLVDTEVELKLNHARVSYPDLSKFTLEEAK